MCLLTKKCENCGTKINKLYDKKNIILLKIGLGSMECPRCSTKYTVSKILAWIFMCYTCGYGWVISLFLLATAYNISGVTSGNEVWFFVLPTYFIIEFIIMLLIPLKPIEEE